MGPHSTDGREILNLNKAEIRVKALKYTEFVTETVGSVLVTSFAEEEEEDEGGKVFVGAMKSKLPKH